MPTAALRPNHYLACVRAYPQLERDHELELARLWRDRRDVVARDTLVRAQLGYVVAIAVRYRRNNNVTLEELVAEGNFGLVYALAKFDPDRGNRLITYSSYWIRAHIGAHLMRSKTLVIAGVHSKLLSSVRRERAKFANTTSDPETADARVAEQLGISVEKLRSLIERANLRDVPWDGGSQDAWVSQSAAAMTVTTVSAEDRALSTETEKQLRAAISAALSSLDVRERYIVERKLMAHREDELSLAEIGRRLGVSRERARQLEIRAKRKMKSALARSLEHPDHVYACERVDIVSREPVRSTVGSLLRGKSERERPLTPHIARRSSHEIDSRRLGGDPSRPHQQG